MARFKPGLGPALVGFSVLALYLRTLAPTITWAHDGADGGDLITAALVGGVAHPPGYPLYLILARLFLLIPLGEPAYRLNLMSAVWGAASAALLVVVIRLTYPVLPGRRSQYAAVVAAFLFALSPVAWGQSLIAEVYSLHTFLSGLVVLLLVLVATRPLQPRGGTRDVPDLGRAPRFFALTGLTIGLAVGNHPTVLLLAPALGLAMVSTCQPLQDLGRAPRQIAAGLLGLALGLSLYVYLPLQAASAPPIAWGEPTTWQGFWWLVSAEPYRQFAFALPMQYVPQRVVALGQLWLEQYTLVGVALGVWGWAQLRQAAPRLLWALTLGALLVVVYALLYNTTDSYVYLLPALWIFAIWIAWGTRDFLMRADRWMPRWGSVRPVHLLTMVILLLPLWSLTRFGQIDLSQDRTAAEYGQRVMESADANAIVIADTDARIFTLWYYRLALGLRPDLTIVAEPLYPYAWYRQQLARQHPDLLATDQPLLPRLVEANRRRRPINLTDPDPNLGLTQPFHWDGVLAHLRD